VFVSAITLLPLVWRGCEATAREQIYLLLLEPAVKNTFSSYFALDIFVHSLTGKKKFFRYHSLWWRSQEAEN
jgi:hypothetical protein